MNLYLVFALALGAISAGPLPQPQPIRVAAQTAVISQRQIALAIRALPAVTNRLDRIPNATREQRIEVPLTGGASPRAPARNR